MLQLIFNPKKIHKPHYAGLDSTDKAVVLEFSVIGNRYHTHIPLGDYRRVGLNYSIYDFLAAFIYNLTPCMQIDCDYVMLTDGSEPNLCTEVHILPQ